VLVQSKNKFGSFTKQPYLCIMNNRSLSKDIDNAKDTFDTVVQEIESLEAEVETLKGRVDELEREVSDKDDEIADLEGRIEQLEKDIRSYQ
jgi:peptidoglycan hydrolase CwlO-like protein